jgi:predicted DNA-binding transcriptional regulator YafY
MNKAKSSKRIQWFHTTVQANGYPNSSLLCERFGISVTQAKRDIAFLRDKLKAPLRYNPLYRGYEYAEAFSLPVALTASNDEHFSGLLAAAGEDDSRFEEAPFENADMTVLQLQIPYTAVLEIPDKLAVAELKSYIRHTHGKSRKLQKNHYTCEFHSVERFLGILFSIDADIRIVSPDWLRERLVRSAERILKINSPAEETESDS